MTRRGITLVLVTVAVLMLSACRAAPIHNISESPITPVSGTEPTLEQVTKAIVAAGLQPRPPWTMRVEEPGHIVASLHIRSHVAVVDITYDTKSYSITYQESTNLKYDPETNTIHSNYNGWIQHLDASIRSQMALL